MTIEEKVERHKQATQYIMTIAMTLGLWFIVEYLLVSLGRNSFMMSEGKILLGAVSAIVLFLMLKHVRNKFFADTDFTFGQCWYYATQLMLFAGLIEALGILVFNNWIAPDNLAELQQAAIHEVELRLSEAKQTTAVIDTTSQIGNLYHTMTDVMDASIETIKEAPVPTPMQAAFSNLFNDIVMGMLWGLPFAQILKKKEKPIEN